MSEFTACLACGVDPNCGHQQGAFDDKTEASESNGPVSFVPVALSLAEPKARDFLVPEVIGRWYVRDPHQRACTRPGFTTGFLSLARTYEQV